MAAPPIGSSVNATENSAARAAACRTFTDSWMTSGPIPSPRRRAMGTSAGTAVERLLDALDHPLGIFGVRPRGALALTTGVCQILEQRLQRLLPCRFHPGLLLDHVRFCARSARTYPTKPPKASSRCMNSGTGVPA